MTYTCIYYLTYFHSTWNRKTLTKIKNGKKEKEKTMMSLPCSDSTVISA